MKDLSNIIYKFRCLRAKRRYEHKIKEEQIYEIAHGHKRNKITMSKLLTIFLFLNFTIVELFSMYMIFIMLDSSALSQLLISIAAECLVFLIYSAKSGVENVNKIQCSSTNVDDNAVG